MASCISHKKRVFFSARSCLLIILIFIASYCAIAPGHSTPDTEISVINPTTSDNNFVFYNYSAPVGYRFNTTVQIYDVADLFSYQVLLNVNDTLLNVTNAWLPAWDVNWVFYGETSVRPAPFFYDNNDNNISESVKIADTLLFGEATFNGDGLLAIIEFEIIFAPEPTEESVSCDLAIDNADTFLLDSSASNEIPAIKTDGHYYYLNLPPGESIISIIVNPPAHIVLGENVSITGSIIPTKNNVTVTIQYKLNVTGAMWQNLTKVQTDSSSQYNYTWETSEAGEFNLKSLWQGDNETSGAESRMLLLEIKYISTISLNVSPTNVTAASTVAMNGTITPTPLEPAIATIEIRLNGTEKWITIGTNTTVNGIYSYNWIATKRNETIVGNSTIRQMENNTFEFRAKWQGDNVTFGSQSQPQYPMVMVHKAAPYVTINVSPQTVERGINVTISGTVEPAISGLPITIEYTTHLKEAPGGSPSILTESKINGSYTATLNTTGLYITDYFVYAFIRKNGDVFETTNYETFEPAVLTVTALNSSITISVNPSEANIGSEVIISGKIEPARENVKVTIQLGSVQKFAYSDAEGRYSFNWRAGNFSTKDFTTGELVINWIAGVYNVYAKWAGDDVYKGATSPTVTLTVVRNSTSLTMGINPKTIALGANVSITGTLTPAKASIDVTIYYKNATSQWILLATVKTNSEGNFSYTWTPGVTGEFELYANWTGDAIDAPAESQILTLRVESPFTIFTYLPYIAVGIAVVAAVALAYLYLKKKKKPSK